MTMTMTDFLIVLRKEIVDALRDRRTLLRLLTPALLMGPLLLLALSGMVASLEERAERRQVMVAGIEHAPTLRNYLERQTYTLIQVKGDYEQQLRDSQLQQPVLVVRDRDFETRLRRGERPTVEIVTNSANLHAGGGGLAQLLQGFGRERAALNLAMRGIAAELLQPLEIDERDLASPQARAARLTNVLPMFIILAMLYGALTAALDSTAGERERGSLEPLLMNPVSHGALVAGKWAAVALLGLAVALLASISFVPAQWLLRSDALQAMFQYGWPEALDFWLLQLPLAAGLSALLMALAIRSKTYKEAQAGSGLIVTLVSLAPMVSLLSPSGDAPWHLWVPGLAQNTLMLLVLKGETLRWDQLLPPLLVGAALTVAGLAYVARSMRAAVAR